MEQQRRTAALSALAELVSITELYLVAIGDFVILAAASIVVCFISGRGFLEAVSIGIPYWVSWFGMAGWLEGYRARAFATLRTCALWTFALWVVASIVGFLVQVSIERMAVPFGRLSVIALLALVLLLAWRCAFALMVPWHRILAQEAGTPEPGLTIGGEAS